MTTDANEGDTETLSPDSAFAVLGNEVRMGIMQTLGEAEEPLSFSELRDRVDVGDEGQLNYHLHKLKGHFVREATDGYDLHRAGRRVIEAVLSGAVTEIPTLETTQVDWPCPYCGAPTEVRYDETTPRPVQLFCTECAGAERTVEPYEHGQVGALHLSPAGIRGRTPRELLRAALIWEHLELLATISGVCPRCAASIEFSVSVCEPHDPSGGVCSRCDQRYAAQFYSRCTNCLFDLQESFAAFVGFANRDVLAFLTAHGHNPVTDTWGPVMDDADEAIVSTEPFEARFTVTIDDDTLAFTVDDDLSVVDVSY